MPRAPAQMQVVRRDTDGAWARLGAMRVLLREGLADAAPQPLLLQDTAGATNASGPSQVLPVPARLGGGVMFVLGRELWYAKSWLDDATPLLAFDEVPRLLAGFREIVVLSPSRAPIGVKITGELVPLDAYPPAPALLDLAVRDHRDGARSAAIVADLLGLAITDDGGTSWRDVTTTRTAQGVRADGSGFVVRGRNSTDAQERSWHVDPFGDTDSEVGVVRDLESATLTDTTWERVLTHGYATHESYYAFDRGVFERFRTRDGARLAHERVGASDASCSVIHFPNALPGADPGFACVSDAETTLWRVQDGALRRVQRWPGARTVWSAEVGALAVSGPCEGAFDADAKNAHLCVWERGSVALAGSLAGDQIVPLRDGTIAVVRPPSGPQSSRRGAELFLDRASKDAKGAVVRGVPLQPSPTQAGKAVESKLLRHFLNGRWYGAEALAHEGLVVWIEHEGRLLGAIVHTDGRVELGAQSAIATAHRVAGLRSLSWSNRDAFESIDGGMHYTSISMPESTPKASIATGCSALGCVLPQLLRIGWGAVPRDHQRPPPAPTKRVVPRVALDCTIHASYTKTQMPSYYGGYSNNVHTFFGVKSPHGKSGAKRPIQARLGVPLGWPTPIDTNDDVPFDSVDPFDRRPNITGVAYVWGNLMLGGDPDAGWLARWFDPQARRVVSSAPTRWTPAMQSLNFLQGGRRLSWSVLPAREGRRALAIVHTPDDSLLFDLRENEAPTPITLEEGSFGTIEAALDAPGDLAYFAGAVGDPAGTAVFRANGGRAEPIARIPRVGKRGKPGAVMLLLHSTNGRVAVAVADPEASRVGSSFFVREVVPELGALRHFVLGDGASALRTCDERSAPGYEGWVKLDIPISMRVGTQSQEVSNSRGRVRFGDDGTVCLQELTTHVSLDAKASGKPSADAISVIVGESTSARALSCRSR